MLRPYRPVLAVPGATRLLASALVARLPQGMASLAVLLLVRGATHSYAAAGVAVGAEALATAAGAPVFGRLIDRLGRHRVLLRCSLLYAAMATLLVLGADMHAPAVALVVLAAGVGATLPPIAPSLRALMRDVFADSGVRERAYALESVAQELVWIAGPLLVALLVAFGSPAVAVLALGAQSMIGTVLFLRSPLTADGERPAVRAARGAALSSRALRGLLVPIGLMGTALGATEVGLPALALHTGSRSSSGVLLALWSLGSMAGGLWFGSRRWRASLPARYGTLLLTAVVCTAPLMLARSLPAAMVSSLLAGVTIAPVFSCQYALVGQAVTEGTETEAFTWVSAALVGGLSAGSAAGGALVASAGLGAPFALACAATGAAGMLALASWPAATRRDHRLA